MINRWQTLDSRTIYENDRMTVREDRVINPGGGQHDYGYVHFKGLAVAVLPIDEHGNTWLVGQSRYTLDAYSWELPMGGAARAEDPLLAAQRELQEETGLTATHWHELMRLHTSNSITDEAGVVYVATGLSEGDTAFEETEDITVRKMPVEEAIRMVVDGEITDAISAAGLLRYALRHEPA